MKDLLATLEECKLVTLDTAANGVVRLQLPFSTDGGSFQLHYDAITVGSHGRFGVSSKAPGTKMETQIVRHIGDESYIVFTNYDHYIISGHAAGADDDVPTYGEIHGGATPEELLVPIIVFDSNSIIPLQAEWEKNPVKIQKKKANAVIKFNQSIASLQINIGSIPANVTATDDNKVWKIVFENIKHGKYTVSIIANGKSVQADELIINSAIGNNDGDFDLCGVYA